MAVEPQLGDQQIASLMQDAIVEYAPEGTLNTTWMFSALTACRRTC